MTDPGSGERRAPAGEEEQLPGELVGAIGRRGHGEQIVPQILGQLGPVQRQREGAFDDRQEVVEIVRDRRRERAEALDFLQLAQLVLQPPAVGDVLDREQGAGAGAVLEGGRIEVDVDLGAR